MPLANIKYTIHFKKLSVVKKSIFYFFFWQSLRLIFFPVTQAGSCSVSAESNRPWLFGFYRFLSGKFSFWIWRWQWSLKLESVHTAVARCSSSLHRRKSDGVWCVLFVKICHQIHHRGLCSQQLEWGSQQSSWCHTEHTSHGSAPGYQDENGAHGAPAFERLNRWSIKWKCKHCHLRDVTQASEMAIVSDLAAYTRTAPL